jgi:hypothetical protein
VIVPPLELWRRLRHRTPSKRKVPCSCGSPKATNAGTRAPCLGTTSTVLSSDYRDSRRDIHHMAEQLEADSAPDG